MTKEERELCRMCDNKHSESEPTSPGNIWASICFEAISILALMASVAVATLAYLMPLQGSPLGAP